MKYSKLKKNIQYELFVIPAILSYTIFIIFPLCKSFFYSFTSFDGVTKNFTFVGFQNYFNILNDKLMFSALSFTLFYTIVLVIGVTILAIPLAIILNMKTPFSNIQRSIFFFPSAVSGLLMGFIWGYLLSPTSFGAVNALLELLGLPVVPWLSDPKLAKMSCGIVSIWALTGWHAVLYLAYLQAVPKSYYEAASIDGATTLQKIRYITLPMLAPAMTISIMMLVTYGLKVYDLPYALTGGGPAASTYTITQVIMLRGITELRYGRAAAMSTIFFFIILLITIIQVTLMQKREERLS